MQSKLKFTNEYIYFKNVEVGKSKLSIYVEKLQNECKYIELLEFIFKINNNTHKTDLKFFYMEMYKIFRQVQLALEEFIEKNIINNVKQNKIFKLEFEADGSTIQEKKSKNSCYEYYLKKLKQKYTNNKVFCSYVKIEDMHYLTFNKLCT